MHIGLVCDLRDEYRAAGYGEEAVAEFDSDSTLAALEDAVRTCGHTVERVGGGRALARRLVQGDRWDLAFTIAEGLEGRNREAQVPALLELYGVPYTFSDPLVCAVTLDKAVAKRLLHSYGLPTPAFRLVRRAEDIETVDLPFPLFVKPVAEGTGKGIDEKSRVSTREELREKALSVLNRLRQPALVETYLPGREFTTGVLGTGADAHALGTMEIRVLPHAAAADYTYAVKEQCESCVSYRRLAPGPLRNAVETLALSAYRALECRDAGRIDIRLDARGRPAFLELNPLPGLHPTHSDLPMIAAREGMDYVDLIGSILDSAARRTDRVCAATLQESRT